MKQVKQIIVLSCMLIYGNNNAARQTLLIFLDTPGQTLSDIEGMNVAHQLLTAVEQKAAPILVAQEVFSHVVQRQQRFAQALKNKGSLAFQVQKLFHLTNQMIAQRTALQTINQTLDHAWYQANFAQLSSLSQDALNSVMFDFFCYQALPKASQFSWYCVPGGCLLAVPEHSTQALLLHSLSKITFDKLCAQHVVQSTSLLRALKSVVDGQAACSWNFYLTGHGYHRSAQHPQAIIAGLTMDDFKKFIVWLNTGIKTNLLVYNSCYSAGIHLIEPYEQEGKPLQLSFPVMLTCLTDAPTYIFGVAAGVKLPPYDATSFLQFQDINAHGLRGYFMQDFAKFVQCAHKKNRYKDCVQSVNAYQECQQKFCTLSKLENIPLIRHVNATFFVPIDRTFIECVLHDSAQSMVIDDKHALLWYIKQYAGTIILQKRLPQFVSMIPGDGTFLIHRCDASSFSLQQILLQSFFSIDDLMGQQIFIFDHLNCRLDFSSIKAQGLQALRNVMIIPAGRFQTIFSEKNCLGYCAFDLSGKTYWLSLNKNKKISKIMQLDEEYKKLLQKFKQFLSHDIASTKHKKAEQLLLPQQFNHRKMLQHHQLEQCVQQKVCAKT